MQIGTVSRLRFCKRSWGFKIYIRWNIVHLVKPYVCSNQLDVWETSVEKNTKMQVKKVAAKSKPMMNLVSRYSARDPNVLASTASESPGKPNLKVKCLWAIGISSNQEQGDLWCALPHHTTHNGTLTTSGLPRSGDLVKCWEQERWDP